MAKKQKDKKINNVDTIIHRKTDNIMAKKQKDKKINNVDTIIHKQTI